MILTLCCLRYWDAVFNKLGATHECQVRDWMWWCGTDVNTCALKNRLCIISRENNKVAKVQVGVQAYQSCSSVFSTPLGRIWLMPTIYGLRWCLGRSGSSRTVCSGWNTELAAAWIRPSWEGKLTSTFVFSAVYLFLSDPSQVKPDVSWVNDFSIHSVISCRASAMDFSLAAFLDPGMRG